MSVHTSRFNRSVFLLSHPVEINPCWAACLALTVRMLGWLPRLVVWLSWFPCFSLVPGLPSWRKKGSTLSRMQSPYLLLSFHFTFSSACFQTEKYFSVHAALSLSALKYLCSSAMVSHVCRMNVWKCVFTWTLHVHTCLCLPVLRHTVMDQTGLPCSVLCALCCVPI